MPVARGDASGGGVGVGVGGRGRLAEALSGVPAVTLAVLVLLISVHVCAALGDFNAVLSASAIVPALVLRGEAWRLVSSAAVHGGLLHLAMNGASLWALGGSLEPLLGSAAFACLLAALAPLCGALYVALAAAAGDLRAAAVGFSGVLFALAVDEAALSPAPTRSVFGLFSVPTRLYPWVLCAALQLLLPNASLLGHLAGLLAGTVHAAGGLAWALPSLPALRRIEAAPPCAPLTRLRAWHRVPDRDVTRGGAGAAADTARQALAAVRAAAAPITQALAVLAACARRGAEAAVRQPQAQHAVAASAPSAPAAEAADPEAAPNPNPTPPAVPSDAARAAAAAAARVRAARAAALLRRANDDGAAGPPAPAVAQPTAVAAAPSVGAAPAAAKAADDDEESETAHLVVSRG